MVTCDYDSGSMTGCQPLCSDPATHSVTYRNGSFVVVNSVCQRHVKDSRNRAYPSVATVGPL